MKVRIVQLLCPQRHCIVANAYESPDGNELSEMVGHLEAWFAEWIRKGARPRCGICQSGDLHYEDMPTRFSTMTEAQPYIEELARRQAFTRVYFRASRG